jgi:hypothetical protein
VARLEFSLISSVPGRQGGGEPDGCRPIDSRVLHQDFKRLATILPAALLPLLLLLLLLLLEAWFFRPDSSAGRGLLRDGQPVA